MLKQRLLTAFVAGILFLIPIVVLFAILGQVFKVAKTIAALGEGSLGLEGLPQAIAFNAIALLFVAFVVVCLGLLAERGLLKGRVRALEDVLAKVIPGYSILKTKVLGAVNAEADIQLTNTVIVRHENSWRLGLEIERAEDGTVVVFLPYVPDPVVGHAAAFSEDDVRRVKIPPKAFLESFEFRGRGLAKLVSDSVNSDAAGSK